MNYGRESAANCQHKIFSKRCGKLYANHRIKDDVHRLNVAVKSGMVGSAMT
jgi:hypothetical protein